MRILGLDVGEATIGVAASDELGLIAHGITTIRRKDIKTDIQAIRNIIEERKIEKVVVGLPKNMNNTIGTSGEKVINFTNILKENFQGVEFILWDERLTTIAAEKTLIKADLSRQKRKKVIDKLAAVLILQGYLDMININR